MEASISLEDRLADALPDQVRARVYHISTPSTASNPIFSAGPGQEDRPTVCESHFLGLSSPEEGNKGELFVFAIEVLIFDTDALTTVFVSKADSSGFISRLHSRSGSPSIPRTITRIFLDYLLRPRLNEKQLVLSLFARSQNQYLFPGSIDNAEKHVLDDRQLIRWWCRVLDSIWRPFDSVPGLDRRTDSFTITAHVVVPGCDRGETRAFFPPSHLQDDDPRWINGYPMKQLSLDTSLPLRCLIPRLPDDPKSRFLNELDSNYIGPSGEWRSVKTMDQFWEMMSYRQECSAGRLVGFIWVVFSPRSAEKGLGPPDQHTTGSFLSDASDVGPLPTPANSQRLTSEQALPGGLTNDNLLPIAHSTTSPPSSPIPELREESVDNVCKESNGGPPAAEVSTGLTPGQASISAIDYEILIEDLLEMDFAGSEMGVQSTRKWLELVANKAGVPSFGVEVVGKRKQDVVCNGTPNNSSQVNMLTGVKKKRKVDQADGATTPSAQLLSTTLVRKKPKLDKLG